MTDRDEKTESDTAVPTLVDLRLTASILIGWLVAIGAGGLAAAILAGESDGWAIAVFVASALVNVVLQIRLSRQFLPPDVHDLVVAPASADVEPAIGTCLRALLLGSLFAAATLGIILLYPVVGAGLAGWLAGHVAAQILTLIRLRRWEAQHRLYLRGVRETGLRFLRGTHSVIAQSR